MSEEGSPRLASARPDTAGAGAVDRVKQSSDRLCPPMAPDLLKEWPAGRGWSRADAFSAAKCMYAAERIHITGDMEEERVKV